MSVVIVQKTLLKGRKLLARIKVVKEVVYMPNSGVIECTVYLFFQGHISNIPKCFGLRSTPKLFFSFFYMYDFLL